MEQFREELDITLSLATHLRLALAIGNMYWNHRPLENANNTSIKLESYLAMFKKGSKPFRKILDRPLLPLNKIPQTVSSFAKIANIDISEFTAKNIQFVAGSWNENCYPTKIKDFILKFKTNKLPINTRLSHIVQNGQINRSCTFCNYSKNLPAPEEKFEHLLWHCPTTKIYSEFFFETYFPEIQNNGEDQKNASGLQASLTLTHHQYLTFWNTHFYSVSGNFILAKSSHPGPHSKTV